MDSKKKNDMFLAVCWSILTIAWILSVTQNVMVVPTSGVILIMFVVSTLKFRNYRINKGDY